MNHRVLRYTEGWEWHMITTGLAEEASSAAAFHAADGSGQLAASTAETVPPDAELAALKRQLPECADWLDACFHRDEAQLTVTELADGEEVLHGTLLLRMSEQREDVSPFHYWVTAGKLVTFQRDLRFMLRLQRAPWEDKLERAVAVPEAFAVLLSAALEPLQDGLDAFERRLELPGEAIGSRNRQDLADLLNRMRHELLHWRLSYIGIQKAASALGEAFTAKLTDSEGCRKLMLRLERTGTVIDQYAEELDTWIAMDEVLVSRRSQALLKSLTVVAVLFAPAAAAGALLGMNVNFPQPSWMTTSWGLPALCGAVLAVTAILGAWLRLRHGSESARRLAPGMYANAVDRASRTRLTRHDARRTRHSAASRSDKPHESAKPALGAAADTDGAEDDGLPSRSARRRT